MDHFKGKVSSCNLWNKVGEEKADPLSLVIGPSQSKKAWSVFSEKNSMTDSSVRHVDSTMNIGTLATVLF